MNRKHILLALVLLIVFGTTILLFTRRPVPVVENPQHSARLSIDAVNPSGTYVAVTSDRTLLLTLKNDAKKSAILKDVSATKPVQTKSGSWTVSPEKIITVKLPGQILKIVIEEDKLVLDQDGDPKTDDEIIFTQQDTKDQGTGGTSDTQTDTTGGTKTGDDITPPEKGGGGEPPVPAPVFDLSGNYRLFSYNGKEVGKDTNYTLTLSSGVLSARFCNTLGGEYSTAPGMVMAPSLVSTEMFCKDPEGLMDMETAFGTMLARGSTASILLASLTLSGQNGDVFVFERDVVSGR